MRFRKKKIEKETNVIDGVELDALIEKVFNSTKERLYAHCGPKSGYAVVFSKSNMGLTNTVFTKDGINILKAIKYNDAKENYILSLLQYIGMAIEDTSGDGTTSSIILTTEVIPKLRSFCKNHNLSNVELNDLFEKLIKHITIEVNNVKCVDDPNNKELRVGIARNQAYVSSHGNTEIVKVVEQLVKDVPTKALEYLVYRQETVETDVNYRVEVTDYEFSHKAFLMHNDMYTDDLGQKMEVENGTLLVACSEIAENGFTTNLFLEKINAYDNKEVPLVIVCPQPNEWAGRIFNTLYNEKRKEGIDLKIIWLPPDQIAQLSAINTLYALNNQNIIFSDTEDLLFKENMHCVFEYDEFKVKGFLTYDKDNICKEAQDENHFLSEYTRMIESRIKVLKDAKEDPSSSRKISELRKIYNHAMFSSIGTLVIGGSLYEAKAALDVVNDVILATRSSLTDGCLVSSYGSFPVIFKLLRKTFECDKQILGLIDIFDDAIRYYHARLYQGDTHAFEAGVCIDLISGCTGMFDETRIADPNYIIPIQPASSYVELFKRIRDMAGKLVSTNCMIVSDTLTN